MNQKVLAFKLMPLPAVIGCISFVVLSLSIVGFAIESSEFVLMLLFLPGALFFGLPFYIRVDPKSVAEQKANESKRITVNRESVTSTISDMFVLATFAVIGLIAIVAIWWLLGLVASLPVGVLLTIIILLLILKR